MEKDKKKFLKGVYLGIGYYLFSFALFYLLLKVGGGGPCNSGLLALAIGMLLFFVALLVGVGCFFSNQPFYRGIGITFCIGSILIFLFFKILQYT